MLDLAVILAFLFPVPPASVPQESSEPRESLVKVFSKVRAPDFLRPWTKQRSEEATGSGFLVEGGLIVTNAHLVHWAHSIHVQPVGADERYAVEVAFVSYPDDLALLRSKDPAALETMIPAVLDVRLPSPGETIRVVGFPTGGKDLSTTEGIVSRLEFQRGSFHGLTIQVDASINPGNSGGPAFAGDRVIGVVFGIEQMTEGIGYLIPAETVRRMLDDAADGTFEGQPRLPLSWSKAENEALREWAGMPREVSGVVLSRPESWDPPGMPVQDWDVLVAIGDQAVDNFGKVEAGPDFQVDWEYAVPRVLAEDGTVPLRVLRAGEELELAVPTYAEIPRLVPSLEGGYPAYYVYGPLVFVEATREFVDGIPTAFMNVFTLLGSPLATRLHEVPADPEERLVVLADELLVHPVSKGYEPSLFPVLQRLDGEPIRNLRDLATRLEAHGPGPVVFEFDGRNLADHQQGWRQGVQDFVFRHEDVLEAREEILEEASIRRHHSEDLADVVAD